jgi:hypothetical protein
MMVFLRAGLASFENADTHSAVPKPIANASFRSHPSSIAGSR